MIPAFVHHLLQVLRILSDTIVSFFHENILGEKSLFSDKRRKLREIVLLKNNFRLIFFPRTWMVNFTILWLLAVEKSVLSVTIYTLFFSKLLCLWCSAMSLCFVKMQISFFFFLILFEIPHTS